MLKIKDNVDLKELEKYGFEFRDNHYKYEYYGCVIEVNNKKNISLNAYSGYFIEDKVLNKLYDLIVNGLVEKALEVEDENNH